MMDNDTKKSWIAAAAGAGLLLAAQAALRRARAYDFRGKAVLIAGGSRGLGLEIARELARQGARVAISARDADELADARRDLEGMGAEGFSIACDITDFQAVGDMVRTVRDRFGSLDALFNVAGMISVGPQESMTIEDYEEAMAVHFWGPLYSCLSALPIMKQQGQGRIVNVSSIGGKVAVPHLLPYCASKFALVGFSRGLRTEVMKDGVVVTTVCPGLMRTGSPRNADFKSQHEKEYSWFAVSDSIPVLSMHSERAARQVVDACRYGLAEVILGAPAKIAAKFDALFPEWDAGLMAIANRMLPSPGGVGTEKRKGYESETRVTQSPLTATTRSAEVRNNEL